MSDSFEGLVLALEEAGFRFACLMNDDLADNGSPKGRVLEQVFFLTDYQIVYAKRFIVSQVLLIDSTFETNRLSLVLLIVVGIIGIGKNFPAVYSFAKSESAVLFHFLFDCMRHFAFSGGVAEAEIVLGDQALGLIAAMPILIPNCKL